MDNFQETQNITSHGELLSFKKDESVKPKAIEEEEDKIESTDTGKKDFHKMSQLEKHQMRINNIDQSLVENEHIIKEGELKWEGKSKKMEEQMEVEKELALASQPNIMKKQQLKTLRKAIDEMQQELNIYKKDYIDELRKKKEKLERKKIALEKKIKELKEIYFPCPMKELFEDYF